MTTSPDPDARLAAPTVRAALQAATARFAAAGFDPPRLEAEVLLAHVLAVGPLDLLLEGSRALSGAEYSAFDAMVARRLTHEPSAYIRGTCGFYGRDFIVTPAVLIPRPDTEVVVEQALALLPTDATGTVIDACTGSGAIAVTLAAERPGITVHATELSTTAAVVARQNVAAHGLEARVTVHEGDLLAPVAHIADARLVVSNPPYILPADMPGLDEDVRAFEPDMALRGDGADGLGFYARLLADAPGVLAQGGALVVECGYDQEAGMRALPHPGFASPRLFRDLADRQRGAVWARTA